MTMSPLPLLVFAILGLAACKPADIPANDTPVPEGAVVTTANDAALDGAEAVPADEGGDQGGGDDDTDTPADAPDLTGRWVGVEGMVLDVAGNDQPGTYTLTMQYDLDHKGVFAGTASGGGIGFVRDGQSLMLRPTNGAATGLKYLADKTDCLTVKPGEGYCRA